MWSPESRCAKAAPDTAALSASVAPPVKITSEGEHPRIAATVSRASSRAAWLVCEMEYTPEALPNCSEK